MRKQKAVELSEEPCLWIWYLETTDSKYIDILALTETWLRPGNCDDLEVGILCPNGYRFLHAPRTHGRGGGVGLLFKYTLRINSSGL